MGYGMRRQGGGGIKGLRNRSMSNFHVVGFQGDMSLTENNDRNVAFKFLAKGSTARVLGLFRISAELK